MAPYDITFTDKFKKKYQNITKKESKNTKKIDKAVNLLSMDPFYPSLKTHKVSTRLHGERYSSWVTGDIRIIWDYDEDDRLVLVMFDIGGHTGRGKVYN